MTTIYSKRRIVKKVMGGSLRTESPNKIYFENYIQIPQSQKYSM